MKNIKNIITFNKNMERHYPIKCECHSPQHFEIKRYCNDCFPVEPEITKLIVRTEVLTYKLKS